MTSMRRPKQESRRKRAIRIIKRRVSEVTMPFKFAYYTPLLVYYLIMRQRERYKDWQNLWPKPPSRNRREVNPTKDQFCHCGLFSKLPYDIRHEIFYYSILGSSNRRAHTAGTLCFTFTRPHDHFYTDKRDPTLTNLLRSCRHIYFEVSYLLYTLTIFKVQGLQDIAKFVCFSRMVSANSLASIKKLIITIPAWQSITYGARSIRKTHPALLPEERFRYPYESILDSHRSYPWQKLWRIVATQMNSLEDLTVVLKEGWKFKVLDRDSVIPRFRSEYHAELSLVPELAEKWVKPILPIRGLKAFKLKLQSSPRNEAFEQRLAVLEETLEKQLCFGYE